MYLNKAIVIGNLTRDPEMRALPSGIKVCTFSVATNRVWKDKNGAKQESADYHNIVVFGRSAETAAQYLRKGASALIEGRMQTRSWEQNGEKKYRTEVIADTVQFGPRSSGGGSAAGGSSRSQQPEDMDDAPPPSAGPGIDYPKDDINPDDIPF